MRLILAVLVSSLAVATVSADGWLEPVEPDDPPAVDPRTHGPPELEEPPRGGVTARLTVDGRPLATQQRGRPGFWFRHNPTNTMPTPRIHYREADSTATFFGLSPGSTYVQANLTRKGYGAMWWPGDFYGGANFDPTAGAVDIPLWELIHMTAPEDNAKVLPRWSSDCSKKPVHPGPLRLAWEPIACCRDDVLYHYEVYRIDCTTRMVYGDSNRVASGRLPDTSLTLDLPASGSDDYYLLGLVARHGNVMVGQLQTRGAGGLGWDYRFRIAASPR